ncbi:MAG TPA: response regulator transcription factor [Steroidobacteraceae bacterium]|jgi:DNA-binding NarL/FixJ family response regulator|nr:response regulator transcription factor [Steroidobacteraceae bacterium]
MDSRESKTLTLASSPIRTLIADGHAVLVDAMQVLLQSLGDLEVVACATDTVAAVNLAVKLRPDVALVGCNVPAMNGIEVARQIRERVPATRILILSMHPSPQYVYQAFRAGADGYVVKDARAAEVIDALRRISKGKRYMGGSVSKLVIDDIAAAGRACDPLGQLTARELDVLRLTADGKSSVASAKLLELSPKTVESYRSRIMRKLEIRDITGLVKFAIRHGIASLDS